MTMTITHLTMTGHLFDMIIVALIDTEWCSTDPSKWKLLGTVVTHLISICKNFNLF